MPTNSPNNPNDRGSSDSEDSGRESDDSLLSNLSDVSYYYTASEGDPLLEGNGGFVVALHNNGSAPTSDRGSDHDVELDRASNQGSDHGSDHGSDLDAGNGIKIPPPPTQDAPNALPVGVLHQPTGTYMCFNGEQLLSWARGAGEWMVENREPLIAFGMKAIPLAVQMGGMANDHKWAEAVGAAAAGLDGLKTVYEAFMKHGGRPSVRAASALTGVATVTGAVVGTHSVADHRLSENRKRIEQLVSMGLSGVGGAAAFFVREKSAWLVNESPRSSAINLSDLESQSNRSVNRGNQPVALPTVPAGLVPLGVQGPPPSQAESSSAGAQRRGQQQPALPSKPEPKRQNALFTR